MLLQMGVLENSITRFFSSISMEIYLSHMDIFRVVDKLGLIQIIGNGLHQYIVTVIIVLGGIILFVIVIQKIITAVSGKINILRIKNN